MTVKLFEDHEMNDLAQAILDTITWAYVLPPEEVRQVIDTLAVEHHEETGLSLGDYIERRIQVAKVALLPRREDGSLDIELDHEAFNRNLAKLLKTI